MTWLLLIFLPVALNKMRVPQIRLPSSQHVKYMPMGYDRPKVVPCPAPSTSSAGGGFNLWSFMTAGVVAATVVGNIVDNVNDNNNNNNNNNNQDNQNSNNMNINNNDNMNMNMNMLNMAMGRGLFEEWVREGTSKVRTKEMENAKKYNELENERHDLSTHDGLTFFFKLVCKVLTSWMKTMTAECAGRIVCEASQQGLIQSSGVSNVLQRVGALGAGLVMADWGAGLNVESLLRATVPGQNCHDVFPCIPRVPEI